MILNASCSHHSGSDRPLSEGECPGWEEAPIAKAAVAVAGRMLAVSRPRIAIGTSLRPAPRPARWPDCENGGEAVASPSSGCPLATGEQVTEQ